MKTIFNIVITAVICLTLSSAGMNTSYVSKTYTLQSTGKNVTLPLLTKSADIISARLKIYGLQAYTVRASGDKGQIVVELSDNIEISEVEGLLTSSGKLAFYETSEISNLPSLLKTGKAGKPLLTRSDVDAISSAPDKSSGYVNTQIKFKPAAVKVWAEATKRNMNKPIAIAVDDQVFYTPVVKAVIEGGSCVVSGNMSVKETNYFVALVNTEPLTVKFTLIR